MSRKREAKALRKAELGGGRPRAQGPGGSYAPGGLAGGFAYDAANLFGQETSEWQPWLRSPDAEINQDRDRMVARSRDLDRNDGWVTGGVTRILDSAIGSQFRLVAKPDYRALQAYSRSFDAVWADEFGRAVEAEYRMWADDTGKWCDAARQLTMTQLYWLALRHKILDGEALGVMLWTPERVGLGGARYNTTVQLLDPDRLSNPYQQVDTPNLRGGVVLDDLGAATGYHIRRAHQGENFAAIESMIWDLFPRETPWGRPVTIHDCDLSRRGQHRGVGILAPVLSRLKMGSRADRAELAQMLLQTIFATVIQSPYDEQDVLSSAEDEGELSAYQQLRMQHAKENPIAVGGVKIPRLAPGEELKAITSTHPNSGFVDFQAHVLRAFAAASGLSAEQVSWDYSKTNYSSARAAMLEAWKTLIRRRDNFAVGFANPIWGCLLEEIMDSGRAPLPRGAPSFVEMKTAYMRCNWIGPARGWVDPVAERQGAVLGMEAGFGTLEQESAEQGRDYEENLDQRQVEIRMMKQRGLPLPQWAAGPPNQPQGGRNDR
ncbi:phage portal protein, lambda family [Roseomonas rosea]|uniref:Phage portal protein, lambda family n=1 Tax=Muricoccus roseus TaxID=198092 RepID=A0A1M6LCH5_9PROT|nr:phage portal protein [Roseomonas rosea]SHJ68879.1 phage portal protein, lambda family [Roseomonas rosea]